MKIEDIELGFNTPYVWMYFLVETSLDYKEILNVLSQLNQYVLASSSKIVSPLNIKQKMFVIVNAQKIHNAEKHWVLEAAAAKSKTPKMLQTMFTIENVDIKIKELYLVHGKLKTQIDTKQEPLKNKVPTICEPEQNLGAFQPAEEFKATTKEELQAMAQFLETKYKIEIKGMSILAYPQEKHKIKEPAEKISARFTKKTEDVLKEDKKKLEYVLMDQLKIAIEELKAEEEEILKLLKKYVGETEKKEIDYETETLRGVVELSGAVVPNKNLFDDAFKEHGKYGW